MAISALALALIISGIASVAGAATSATVAGVNNAKNIEAQREANAQNIAYQKEVNDQNQYNLEHAHQIEMADLQAAGLNPVLTATGGSGASLQRLEAPSVQPIRSDVSGITGAINGMGSALQSMMMMSAMADMRKEISLSHDQTLLAMSGKRDEVLNQLYKRKADAYSRSNSANTLSTFSQQAQESKEIQEMIRIAKTNIWKDPEKLSKELAKLKKLGY